MSRYIDADELKIFMRIRLTGNALYTPNGIDEFVDSLPAAYVVKRGRWLESKIENERYVCSVCGGACWYYDYQSEVAKSNYCPNCGAKMEGEEE